MMKRSLVLLLSMALVFFSCETDPAVQPDPVTLSLIEIDKHHGILVDAYKELGSALTQEAVLKCRKSSSDPWEFMETMYETSNKAFEKVLINKLGQEAADYYLYIEGIKGNVQKEAIMDLMTQENSTSTYSALLKKQLKEKSAATSEWLVFKNLVLADGKTHDIPMESLSLNFTKITSAIDLSDLLLDIGLTEQERTKAMQDAFDIAQIPPVAIGLLLPAVQKAREAAKAQEADEMFLDWLDEEVIPTVQGALDRDIIRRKAFFEYLGGLDVIINERYDNTDQVGASVAILKARYDMRLLSLWADYWNLEQAE